MKTITAVILALLNTTSASAPRSNGNANWLASLNEDIEFYKDKETQPKDKTWT